MTLQPHFPITTSSIPTSIYVKLFAKIPFRNAASKSKTLVSNNKIIIIRFSNNDEIIEELFEYNGNCNIYYAKMVDKDLNEYDLITKKPALQTWGALGTKRLDDNSTSKYLWESLTTDYDDLTFNGNNSYVKSLKQVSKIDNEANTITTTKETSRKLSYLGKKDTNLTTLSKIGNNTSMWWLLHLPHHPHPYE